MFLDTVNNPIPPAEKATLAPPLFERWQTMPHSRIDHHGGVCCERAKEWFLSMDFSMQAGSSSFTGPRWIRQRYEWGPSLHPMYWCEAVKRTASDCGVLAALAHEAFSARGVKSFPVQLVQQYSADATSHWGNKWNAQDTPTHWLNGDIIYHEACAVLMPDDTTKLWDASAAWWMDPTQTEGYGSLAALRIHAAGANAGREFQWGTWRIPANQWVGLGSE